MDNHTINVFLEEIAIQCRYALGAGSQLNNALKALDQDIDGIDKLKRREFLQGEVFRGLHSLLTHTSNVSRILWPPDGKGAKAKRRVDRGIALRRHLRLPDAGHPLMDRTLRDHLEHFDERLDTWAETSGRRNFIQDNIGSREALPNFDEGDKLRWYDPSIRQFIFRGQAFDIQQVVSEIVNLLPKVEAASEKARETAHR